MYKDAHILFSGKKEEPKENVVFPLLLPLPFSPHVCTQASPEEMCGKGGGVLFCIDTCFFAVSASSFSLPSLILTHDSTTLLVSALSFFSEEKEKPKEKWWKSVVICLFRGLRPVQFAEKYTCSFFKEKGKAKEEWHRRSIDTCFFAALPSHFFFSSPLYTHSGTALFVCVSSSPAGV